MGKQAKLKAYRKQVRNIAQETLPSVLAAESVQAIGKQALEVVGARLDTVSENVDKQLKVIDTQTNTFRTYLMKDAAAQISRELTAISVTMVAWQEVLAEKLGFDISNFNVEVEARKKIVLERLEKEAKELEETEKKRAAEATTAKAQEAADPNDGDIIISPTTAAALTEALSASSAAKEGE